MRSATSLPVQILRRPQDDHEAEWEPFGEGPGFFEFDPHDAVALYLPRAEDESLEALVEEWQTCPQLCRVDVSEGRRVSDQGLRLLSRLSQINELNLSACSISNQGLEFLLKMPNLQWLDISHCTGIGDLGLRRVEQMRGLRYINLRGLPRVTQAGLKRLEVNRRALEVRR